MKVTKQQLIAYLATKAYFLQHDGDVVVFKINKKIDLPEIIIFPDTEPMEPNPTEVNTCKSQYCGGHSKAPKEQRVPEKINVTFPLNALGETLLLQELTIKINVLIEYLLSQK